jgi:hypothetical protein
MAWTAAVAIAIGKVRSLDAPHHSRHDDFLPLNSYRWSRFLADDGNRVNQLPMTLGRDYPSQEVQKIGSEERVTGKIVET